MADPTTDTGNVFPPYRIEKDPFHKPPRVLRYYEVSLEGIPPTPSTVPAVHDEDKNGNKQNDFMSKIEGVTSDTSSEDIKSVLEEFASLKLDINRLARFAICRNAVKVVEYLVKKAGADLNGNDTKNRSAGCYAMWDYPDDQMFEFLASTLPQLENSTPQNYWGGALRFAITFKCFGALDFLLTKLYPDAQITDEITDKWVTQCDPVWGRGLVEAWFLRSILGYKRLECQIPPLFCVSTRRDARISFWLRSEDGSWSRPPVEFYDKDRAFIWVHLPWANYALRRYGQDAGCPTWGTDWLPSLFRQPFKAPSNPDLPYTDPVYESSFGATFGDVPRAFMIFPCLVLRSKSTHQKARIRINGMREKIQSKLVKSMLEPELTLDEAYFPSLPNGVLKDRNEFQVVSRKHRGIKAGEKTDDTQPILMVAQLWIWRCDSYILTAFSENNPENIPRWEEKYLEDFIKHLGTFVSRTPVSPCVQMGLILAHQILEFDNLQADGGFGNSQFSAKFSSLLDIFEESTADILEDVNTYMNLRAQPQSQSDTDPVVYPQLDIRKEKNFMFQIADIREELTMINRVLEQQSEVLQAFIEDSERYDPDVGGSPDHKLPRKFSKADKDEITDKPSKADKDETTEKPSTIDKETIKKEEAEKKKQNKQEEAEKKRKIKQEEAEKKKKWNQVKRSKNMIKKYQKRVKKIDEDAERVEKQIQDQLNLKRTYASIQDARASLILGTAVAGFTIITIIFAPLAFVTALFAPRWRRTGYSCVLYKLYWNMVCYG
ncbi:hypothetical protein NUW58_g223 [Xylaria curta]|uniref:Uncharacterized protein n=1 Tax=Xylaria curta TaxID=42375 RepID=A0ACC1PRT8_9PEZI|nr:hypothetical protein NUW58_g223 [Xylaria curta]